MIKKYEIENGEIINPSIKYLKKLSDLGMNIDGFNLLKHKENAFEWKQFTSTKVASTGKKIGLFTENIINRNNNSEEYKNIISILNVFKIVFQDYLTEHKNCKFWMPYINSFDLNNNSWIDYFLTILKHNKNDTDPSGAYTMGYHVDSSDANIEPGFKHAVTVNIYLNDDYEDGRINFALNNDLDSKKNKIDSIVSYKPKAGDIVVYPSIWPVAHAVTFPKKTDRYLINSILMWNYDGSMGEDLKKYLIEDKLVFNDLLNDVKEKDYLYIDGKNL